MSFSEVDTQWVSHQLISKMKQYTLAHVGAYRPAMKQREMISVMTYDKRSVMNVPFPS